MEMLLVIAAVAVVAALILWGVMRRRHRGPEPEWDPAEQRRIPRRGGPDDPTPRYPGEAQVPYGDMGGSL